MRFKSMDDRLLWLKAAANKIYDMEHQRKIAILQGDFFKATELLKGIKFARREFRKQSLKVQREAA